ncbi:MAG: hypothetical protein ACFFAS_19560 [Promethearchaeota archaeon]
MKCDKQESNEIRSSVQFRNPELGQDLKNFASYNYVGLFSMQ